MAWAMTLLMADSTQACTVAVTMGESIPNNNYSHAAEAEGEVRG
jgi:hypothetical protein